MDSESGSENVFIVEGPFPDPDKMMDSEEIISEISSDEEIISETCANERIIPDTSDNEEIIPDTSANEEIVTETSANEEIIIEASANEEIATSSAAAEDAGSSNTPPDLDSLETIHMLEKVCNKSEPYKTVVMLTTLDDDEPAQSPEIEEDELIESEGKPSSPSDDNLFCHLCKRKFTKICNKLRHMRVVHNVKVSSGSCIKCMECNITFCQLYALREHLAVKHNLEMVEYELRFPNMEAFQKWKYEIERKTLSSYILRHGARNGPHGPRFFYSCHRSGKYLPKTKQINNQRMRMIKFQGSCKMGILCTASISVQVSPKEVHVRYCPNHYGHGKETTLIQLSSQEQDAIKESVAQGMSYEKLLDDIRDAQSTKDQFQLYLLKKKDIRCINNAYNCDDFNTAMSDADSVDHWVSMCCQMENSPILFYRKEQSPNDKKYQEDFILIIMTEYQKHILQLGDKNVICVDSLYRKKGGRFYLTVLFIMDETDLAFPVAFCISNKVDQHVISTFYQTLYEAAGELHCKFFMSDCEVYLYDTWKMIMNDNPRWLWSMWYVDNRFRVQMRVFRGQIEKRAEAYKTMRMLLECQNPTVFQCMLKNFAEHLKSDPASKELGNIVENHYTPNAEIWAYCYRKELDLATNIHLEIMHRTLRYCCREGRKTRLDKFIFVIMKLLRDKLFDRLCSLLDDDKIEIALNTINECHKLGLEIPPDSITPLSEKTWLIKVEEEDNFYVTREYEKCPELCNLKCVECNICVHNYVCSCIHNLINANLCPHIHAVVWHLLTPHFTPPSSPVPLLSITKVDEPEVESVFFSSLLKKCHEVYKQIQVNKPKLNTLALNSLMKRLNECVDICCGKLEDDYKKAKKKNTDYSPLNPPVYVVNSTPIKPSNSSNDSNLLSNSSSGIASGSQSMLLPRASTKPIQLTNTSPGIASSSQQMLISSASNKPIQFSNAGFSSASNKPIQFSNAGFSSANNTQPIVISNVMSASTNNAIQISNAGFSGGNNTQPIMISNAVPSSLNNSIQISNAGFSNSNISHPIVYSSAVTASNNSQSFVISNAVPGSKNCPFVISSALPGSNNNGPYIISSTVPASNNNAPFVMSNTVPASNNNAPIVISNTVPASNNNAPIVISNTVPVSKSYRPALLPNTAYAKKRSALRSTLKPIASSALKPNILSAQGGGFYFLVPPSPSTVPIKVEKS